MAGKASINIANIKVILFLPMSWLSFASWFDASGPCPGILPFTSFPFYLHSTFPLTHVACMPLTSIHWAIHWAIHCRRHHLIVRPLLFCFPSCVVGWPSYCFSNLCASVGILMVAGVALPPHALLKEEFFGIPISHSRVLRGSTLLLCLFSQRGKAPLSTSWISLYAPLLLVFTYLMLFLKRGILETFLYS